MLFLAILFAELGFKMWIGIFTAEMKCYVCKQGSAEGSALIYVSSPQRSPCRLECCACDRNVVGSNPATTGAWSKDLNP